MNQQSFLLLQGVASPFFSELGKALKHAGHDVLKINFCGGDLLSGRFFLRFLKTINYKGEIDEHSLTAFYEAVFKQSNITDIIVFGDSRPIHIPAIRLAKKSNINIHVFEEGYLRPHWITLERGGVNANSNLPKDPQDFLDFSENNVFSSEQPHATGGGLAIRAWHDIRYQLASFFLKPLFPNYQSHRPDSPLQEYLGWFKRMPSLWFYHNKHDKKVIADLLNSQKTFYLLPLQLDADSQIRLHSPFKNISEFIQLSIASFAKFAPKDAVLVVKNHPLDPWFINFSEVIRQSMKDNNLILNPDNDDNGERVIYLETGNLPLLLDHAKGTVVINSTVGTLSLSKNCPVIVLGTAIYNLWGLTFQGSLDAFWTQASPPDKTLFDAFQNTLIQQTQINGSFYNHKGIKMAVRNSLNTLHPLKSTQK